MRDAVAGEPAQETFLRAQARLRSENAYQAPVMLGSSEARRRPFSDTHRPTWESPHRRRREGQP